MIALALLLTLAADDLSPEKAAKVQKDRDQAMADVQKKYGNKKSSELSSDERREMIRDQRAAEAGVLEKNNVDAKEFARYEAKMSLNDRAATKAERERLDRKEQDDKKAEAAKQQQGNTEVQIQRGFNENNPVVLEENKGSGNVIVEKGLPAEAQQDQSEASGGSGLPADTSSSGSSGKKK